MEYPDSYKIVVSIIVPVYNAERWLIKMLDSVLMQSYGNWEMILINDGSTDGSEAIIQSYIKRDSRFQCITQPNSGPSIARNRGIKTAKGKYLSFIDADDWVSKYYLEKLIKPMRNCSEIDLVCGGYYEVNKLISDGLPLHDFNEDSHNKSIDKKDFQSNIFTGISGVLWGKLFKRDIFINNNIQLHSELKLSEDLLAVLWYSLYVFKAYIISDNIYYYNRIEENGLSGSLTVSKYQNIEVLTNEIYKFKEELPFLSLDNILNKRKYSFMVKLLKDNSNNKTEFYKVADFLLRTESPVDQNLFQDSKFNNQLLKWVFQHKFLMSWILIKVYQILRKIKHG